MKKWTALLGTAVVALSVLTPNAEAATLLQQKEERTPILVALNENDVSKEQLIQKLKQALPEMFQSYTNKDFTMAMMSHHYQDDETIRYELMFNKMVNKQTESGSVTFIGDNLDIESFNYYPANTSNALFPGKISEEQAKTIADQFVKKRINSEEYSYVKDMPYYRYNQIITQPIVYTYNYLRTENKIPINDQMLSVSVLADGTIQFFHQYSGEQKRLAFEDKVNIHSEQQAIQKFKDNFKLQLQYKVVYDMQSGNPKIELVYEPVTSVIGLHATSNKWATYTDFSEELPTTGKLEPLVASAISPTGPITVEQAKQYVKELVTQESKNTKFTIDSSYEHESNGTEIININYSYHFGNSTHSASMEFNKKTGELISYMNLYDTLPQQDTDKKQQPKLATEQVIEIAEKFAVKMAAASAHEYFKPISIPVYDEQSAMHHVTFPRIKNGLVVNGDNLSVTVGDDGTVQSFYHATYEIEDWPNPKDAVAQSKATAVFNEAIRTKLVYSKVGQNSDSYKLIYVPIMNGQEYYYIDALTGKIVNSYINEKEVITVKHPTVEKELNYLIHAGAIDVKDAATFNADQAITKGQALNTLVKSITYFYEDYYSHVIEPPPASFENIDSEHPYYTIVERATSVGILKPSQDQFNPDDKLTREELAVWYMRTLGLDKAAEHSKIFKIDVADKELITPSNIGYVALSHALGLQKLEQSKFNPTKEVSYAELAPSIIELAYAIAEKQRNASY